MSADLFAAFGETEQQKWGSNSNTTTPQRPAPQNQSWQTDKQPAPALEDDDDFGDFEGTNAWNEDFEEDQKPNQPSQRVEAKSSWTIGAIEPVSNGADVLFDADEPQPIEDGDDDDDFGDFEESSPPPGASSKPIVQDPAPKALVTELANDLDLLDLVEVPPTPPKPTPPKPTPRKTTTHIRSLSKPKVRTEKPLPPKSPAITSATESWDDFSTTTPNPPTSTLSSNTTFTFPLLLPSISLPPPSPSPLPPSNIPPPSVLLPLFPPLLTQTSSLLSSLLALSPTDRHPHLLSPVLQTLLTSHLSLLQTLAHIIAARKLRWRRDKRLAQSMSIGPSVSGRSGGMKLAGVDKGEQGREEVEVREAVRAFKAHVGVVRGVVGQVNALVNPIEKKQQGMGGLGDMAELVGGMGRGEEEKVIVERRRVIKAVPEIGETMPVRTATRGEGAMVSTQPCGLCGMKREERVQKVDEGVEDSFGEWWIEGTNLHTGCWRFWEGFKDKLGQR